MNAPFDPLLPQRLPTPQNSDVSTLQNEVRVRLFGYKLPDLAPLFAFKQSFVDFDFDEASRLKLLTYFIENRFSQA